MARTKKAEFPAFLPPTPCTLNMRLKVVEIAEKNGLSIADVQRRAFDFFLSQNSSIANENVCLAENASNKPLHGSGSK